jgi:hypothetical protein
MDFIPVNSNISIGANDSFMTRGLSQNKSQNTNLQDPKQITNTRIKKRNHKSQAPSFKE